MLFFENINLRTPCLLAVPCRPAWKECSLLISLCMTYRAWVQQPRLLENWG